MAFLQQADLDSLTILRSVFHIVGPGENHFQLLSEFDGKRFFPFFKERIKSVNIGNSYKFLPDSPVRLQLGRIMSNETKFQEESENIATAFNTAHGGAAAIGAFMIFFLNSNCGPFFALLKFDDEKVLSYDFSQSDKGRPVPVFGEVERTFVANRNALQKAALIQLGSTSDRICLVDRQNPQKPAAYFENFLLAVRARTEHEMTSALSKVTLDVIRKHKSTLPPDTTKIAYQRLFDASEQSTPVDAEKVDDWFRGIVGPLPENSTVLKDFKANLKKHGLGGKSFNFSKGALARPKNRRIETASGIKLAFPLNLPNSVVNIDSTNGIITIRDRITLDDLDQDIIAPPSSPRVEDAKADS